MRLCQYTGQRFSTRSNWDWWGKSEILCSRYWRTRIVSLTLTQQWVRVSSVDFMLCGKGSQGSNGEFGATSKTLKTVLCVCVCQTMRDLIKSCLEMAHKSSRKSIAIPAIGTGNLRVPAVTACWVMYDEVDKFSQNNAATSLTDIRCVVYNKDLRTIAVCSLLSTTRSPTRGAGSPGHGGQLTP